MQTAPTESKFKTYYELTKPKIWYLLVFTALGTAVTASNTACVSSDMDSVISLVRLIALSGVNACKYAFVSSSKCSGLSEILSKTPGSLTTDVGLPVTIISNDVCASAKRGRR